MNKMIDIDKCMNWWKDNRGNYRANMGNRDGTDAEEELINTLYAEVKRLREQVKDLEYEVEHWQGELQSRMHPIDYDALVNGGEEE